MMSRRWALLDRDGTIIVNHEYLADAAKVELIPGAARAIRDLRARGLSIGVVTNQSVIARGDTDEAGLARIHTRLAELLAAEGAALDVIVHCPHVASDGCDCRKPRTGLVDQIAAVHPIDRAASFVVGDDAKDIVLGKAIGATTLLVRTGHGSRIEAEGQVSPDHVCDDLAAAAAVIASLL